MVDITVIIPVYNVEKYLSNCIQSVISQSKKEIEIICVNDGSTDKSGEILDNFAALDRRIKVVHFECNKGRIAARKIGVQMAAGRYIMFLDSDDYYTDDACMTAFQEIENANVEILHFGTTVINAGLSSQYEYDSIVSFFRPYINNLYGEKVLEECFKEEKYNYNLVDKIYSAQLCRKAFSSISEINCCMAEDMMLYFIISYYAKSYMGIERKLYNYNFAIGVSKPGPINLEGLDKRCTSAAACFTIRDFLYLQECFEKYESTYIKIERRLLSDNFDAWYYRLPVTERKEGYNIFLKHWGTDKVILSLLYDVENKQYDINIKGAKISELEQNIRSAQAEEAKHLEELKRSMERNIELEEKLLLNRQEMENKILEYNNKAKEQTEKIQNIQTEYERISNSFSYRLGLMITKIPRIIVHMIKGVV